MQIHSKKVVGATWCPMQTGPAARWMGGERQGGEEGGVRGGGWGEGERWWESPQELVLSISNGPYTIICRMNY